MRSTHVVQQLSFSLFLSILTFEFDLILLSFFTFWGSNGLFFGLGEGLQTVLGSTQVVEQPSFSGPVGPEMLVPLNYKCFTFYTKII